MISRERGSVGSTTGTGWLSDGLRQGGTPEKEDEGRGGSISKLILAFNSLW
jgi:hypothetical protein